MHFNEGTVYCSRPITQSMELAAAAVQVAIRLDPDDDDARGTYGIVKIGAGQIDEAWNEVTQGSPDGQSLSWTYGAQGAVQQYAGQPVEGRARLLKSLQLAPRDPRNAILLSQLTVSHYMQGDYTAAVETARRGLTRYPNYPLLHRWLAAALGELGRSNEARDALYRARSISPASFTFYVERRPAWFSSEQYELLLDGLVKAGWQG